MMQKIIILDMKEYFKRLGFGQSSVKNKKLLWQKMVFYNEELDLEITLLANKKQKPQFI